MPAMPPDNLKTYRASTRIAGEHKNCGFCRERIRVGMPVQFVPDRGCWHAGCVESLLAHAEPTPDDPYAPKNDGERAAYAQARHDAAYRRVIARLDAQLNGER